jgi:MFS family permease
LVFGPLSDKVGRKVIIFPGMAIQGAGLLGFVWFDSYTGYIAAAAIVGLGTAMVYPTLLALVSDVSGVSWRASALGVYRFWRDLGYAVGAISTGIMADALDIPTSIMVVAGLAFAASVVVLVRVEK